MLDLSAAAIIEKNKLVSDSVWIILLEVGTPEGPLRLASNNVDITWGGFVWTAFPFIIDNIKYDKEELIEIPVRISNVSRLIEYYVEFHDGLVDQEVTLRVVNSEFLEEEKPELEERFVIVSSSTDSNWCTFRLGSAVPFRQRFPKDRILKDFCPFPYKGVECGCISVESDCPKTLYGCYLRGNMQRFGGEPSMVIGGLYTNLLGSYTVTTTPIHSGTKPSSESSHGTYNNGDNSSSDDEYEEDEE